MKFIIGLSPRYCVKYWYIALEVVESGWFANHSVNSASTYGAAPPRISLRAGAPHVPTTSAPRYMTFGACFLKLFRQVEKYCAANWVTHASRSAATFGLAFGS